MVVANDHENWNIELMLKNVGGIVTENHADFECECLGSKSLHLQDIGKFLTSQVCCQVSWFQRYQRSRDTADCILF